MTLLPQTSATFAVLEASPGGAHLDRQLQSARDSQDGCVWATHPPCAKFAKTDPGTAVPGAAWRSSRPRGRCRARRGALHASTRGAFHRPRGSAGEARSSTPRASCLRTLRRALICLVRKLYPFAWCLFSARDPGHRRTHKLIRQAVCILSH